MKKEKQKGEKEQKKIQFSFQNATYEVGMMAYSLDKILLPDGNLLKVTDWSETNPPEAMGLHIIGFHLSFGESRKKLAKKLCAAVAEEI